MAAHLHDSVLQTLALIQNRGGASSDVARLARAQERELRAWLYDGDQPADSDLATDLRDYAAALELDYPVRIDVVVAGVSSERASGEIAAAARHLGIPVIVLAGQVSVDKSTTRVSGIMSALAMSEYAGSVRLALADAANQLMGLASETAARLGNSGPPGYR